MAKLTEPMIIARTKCSDLNSIKKLNCWGNELTDVSLVQKMPNVEVLALSVNNISTLADFQHCNKLSELYLRKNRIHSLNELCYLQHLPNLRNLTLTENPCTNADNYRLSVVKALPRLKTLDNEEVSDEERRNAVRLGCDLVHPEDEADPGSWSQPVDSYHDQRLGMSNGMQGPAEASSVPEQCWEVDLEENEAAATQSAVVPTGSAGQSFDSAKDGHCRKARLMHGGRVRWCYDHGMVSPGQTPPDMGSPEPPRCYQDEYADRRNANYDNHSAHSEQLGYLRPSTSYQPSGQVYQQTSSGYYAQSPTSPENHVPQLHRRRGDSSPDLPPSPSTPPFAQAASMNGGGSPSEHDRGPRCRADGESRLCPELPPLYPCSHQEDDYYRAQQQQVQQPRHRFSPASSHPAVGTIPSTRRKSRTSNILSAVLCLLKELDYQSLEVVETTVNAHMNELMHEHTA